MRRQHARARLRLAQRCHGRRYQVPARREGILLDPTYSGKTFAVLLAMLQQGDYQRNDNLVFLHTGGTASLFAYPELVEE